MQFDPQNFGEGFHFFVEQERALLVNSLGLILHLGTFIMLFLVFRFGNRYRKVFTAWFALNWLFLFGYWGVWATIYWWGKGLTYLAAYAATPVLLGLIARTWIRELLHPSTDLDLRSLPRARFVVLPILAWGLWYPAYIYGEGFAFSFRDLLFSSYGLMPCPTTMVVLGLLTMKYPAVNKRLYLLFTVYALLIGTATVLSGWLPDIPFIVLGIYALGLHVFLGGRRGK